MGVDRKQWSEDSSPAYHDDLVKWGRRLQCDADVTVFCGRTDVAGFSSRRQIIYPRLFFAFRMSNVLVSFRSTHCEPTTAWASTANRSHDASVTCAGRIEAGLTAFLDVRGSPIYKLSQHVGSGSRSAGELCGRLPQPSRLGHHANAGVLGLLDEKRWRPLRPLDADAMHQPQLSWRTLLRARARAVQ